MKKKIGILVGSLRKDSYNRLVAREVVALLPENYEPTFIEIGNLPFYNEDLDTENPPVEFVNFRKSIKEQDALLFVTPEYNRSVPAALKNAIDVGSRPVGKGVWAGKPAGVISVSQGMISGFGANHHLRQSLVCVDVYPLQQPEAYIGSIKSVLDENGKLKEAQVAFLTKFVQALVKHIDRF